MMSAKPFLMFQNGDAQAALDFWFATLPDSHLVRVERYGADGPGPAGTIKVATFMICGREFMCSDSFMKHAFAFTPSTSIFVDCASVEELERVFGALSAGGSVLMPPGDYGFSRQFGWCSDRFGVSWQVNVPNA